ncbi:hypothetical protein P7C70_g2191, partial [Phenoliferia sp. Uapishka_3]
MSSPHAALTLLPKFLSTFEQSTLLQASLSLLQQPALTSSSSRKLYRSYTKTLSSPPDLKTFPPDSAFDFEKRHFDGVISGYREVLLRKGSWHGEELGKVLQRLYALLPAKPLATGEEAKRIVGWPDDEKTPMTDADPPNHLIAHLLHLSSEGAIWPHVDNKEAFGSTIVGVSLGGERVMRFKRVEGEGIEEFDVLLEPGSVYIQRDPLRTNYTHEIPAKAMWEGREVGGTQRMSLMLRVRTIMRGALSLPSLVLALSQLASSAPLPNQEYGCGIGIGVGVGVEVGGSQPRVKAGTQDPYNPCPPGWAKSEIEIDLCIEIGEIVVRLGGPLDGLHYASPYKKPTGTPKPKEGKKKPKPTWTGKPKETHKAKPVFHKKPLLGPGPVIVVPHPGEAPGNSNGNGCPSGKQRGNIGTLIDICIDLDLFGAGGAVVVGVGAGQGAPATPPTPAAKPKKPKGKQMPPCDGPMDPRAILKLCVSVGDPYNPLLDIGASIGDGDSLFGGGGGVKIGQHPTPDDASDIIKNPKDVIKKEPVPLLPPCGKDDPKEALKLCIKADVGGGKGADVNVGAKVGGGKDPLVDVGVGAKVGGDKNPLVDVGVGAKVGGAKDPLVDVGVGANVGGAKNPLLDLGIGVKAGDSGDNGDLLGGVGETVNGLLGGLFGGGGAVKIGKHPSTDDANPVDNPKDDKKAPLVDANASVGKDGVKADAKVAGNTVADVGVGGKDGLKVDVPGVANVSAGKDGVKANVLGLAQVDVGGKPGSPLLGVKVPGLLSADIGGGSDPAPEVKAKSGGAAKADGSAEAGGAAPPTKCPTGQILHLGVCIAAKADVLGIVKADAVANVCPISPALHGSLLTILFL